MLSLNEIPTQLHRQLHHDYFQITVKPKSMMRNRKWINELDDTTIRKWKIHYQHGDGSQGGTPLTEGATIELFEGTEFEAYMVAEGLNTKLNGTMSRRSSWEDPTIRYSLSGEQGAMPSKNEQTTKLPGWLSPGTVINSGVEGKRSLEKAIQIDLIRDGGTRIFQGELGSVYYQFFHDGQLYPEYPTWQTKPVPLDIQLTIVDKF